MTAAIIPDSSVRLEFDENGKLRPPTDDQCMAILTESATSYRSARFAIAGIDGLNSEILGWGIALPEFVITYLPSLAISGHFSTPANLIALLRHSFNARLIWIDPEPKRWTDEDEDEDER